MEKVDKLIEQVQEDVITWRRHLHKRSHQRQVALMQGAHRGDQHHPPTGVTQGAVTSDTDRGVGYTLSCPALN